MLCKHCGSPIQENEKFCTVCGNKLDYDTEYAQNFAPTEIIMPDTFNQVDNNNYNQSNIAENVEKTNKKKKLKKGKIIFIFILVLTLSLAVALTAVFFTSPAYSVYKQMDENEISSALSEYRVDVKDNFLQEKILSTLLKDSVEQVATEYTNGMISYSAAMDELNALEEMKMENVYAKQTQIMKSYADETVTKYDNGKITYADAMTALETLKADGYTEAEALIEKITLSHNADASMDKAEEYHKNGEYESAINEYSKIPEGNENYESAQKNIESVCNDYLDFSVETAKKHNTSNKPTLAIEVINKALQVIPESFDTSKLDTVKEESVSIYQTNITNEVNELVEEEKWTEAFALINEAIAFENNEYFTTLKTTTEGKYVESVSAKVYAYMDAEDFISAKRVAEHALTILPGNTDLKNLKKEVEEKTPTYLLDVCAPYEYYGYIKYVDGNKFAMSRKEYTNGFTLYGNNASLFGDAYCYAYFNLEGKYTSISFDIGQEDGGGVNTSKVEIYCDNVLTKTYIIKGGDVPERVSFDITGVNQLQIKRIDFDEDSIRKVGFGNIIVT